LLCRRLTHGPPHQILDLTTTGLNVGCEALAARLPELRPLLHVFGHIHEAHGVQIGEWLQPEQDDDDASAENRPTVFVNAANWPSGKRARDEDGSRILFGGSNFQPVIVDLLDE